MSWLTAWLMCGLLGAALDLRSIRDLVNDDLTSWIGAAVAVTVAPTDAPLPDAPEDELQPFISEPPRPAPAAETGVQQQQQQQ